MMDRGFRVEVRGNMVTQIRSLADDELAKATLIDDPLEASTRLAQNNMVNGCLDGDYDFNAFTTARYFATLCLEFMQKLCEKSLNSINESASDRDTAWRNQHIPPAQSPAGEE